MSIHALFIFSVHHLTTRPNPNSSDEEVNRTSTLLSSATSSDLSSLSRLFDSSTKEAQRNAAISANTSKIRRAFQPESALLDQFSEDIASDIGYMSVEKRETRIKEFF